MKAPGYNIKTKGAIKSSGLLSSEGRAFCASRIRKGATVKTLEQVLKASLYASRMSELRQTARGLGIKVPAKAKKRELVSALKAHPEFRQQRSATARDLREARGLIRDLNMEVRSPNMVGALRGSLQSAERKAPDAGTRRQMAAAEDKVGRHIFADLDAWRAKEQLRAYGAPKDRRLLPKDSANRPANQRGDQARARARNRIAGTSGKGPSRAR